MSRVYTAADIEEVAQAGGTYLNLESGAIVTPAALDVAAARGINLDRSGPDAKPDSAQDEEACTCEVEEGVESSVRSVIRSIVRANPGADASVITAQTLQALGASGGASVGTPDQARPRDGRLLPSKAKGAKPVFFDDGGVTDTLIGVITSLSSELWATRERLDSLERVLAAKGTIAADAVENFRPTSEVAEERSAAALEYVSRVFRVFEQMREEIVAGETGDDYMEVIRQAYGQL